MRERERGGCGERERASCGKSRLSPLLLLFPLLPLALRRRGDAQLRLPSLCRGALVCNPHVHFPGLSASAHVRPTAASRPLPLPSSLLRSLAVFGGFQAARRLISSQTCALTPALRAQWLVFGSAARPSARTPRDSTNKNRDNTIDRRKEKNHIIIILKTTASPPVALYCAEVRQLSVFMKAALLVLSAEPLGIPSSI